LGSHVVMFRGLHKNDDGSEEFHRHETDFLWMYYICARVRARLRVKVALAVPDLNHLLSVFHLLVCNGICVPIFWPWFCSVYFYLVQYGLPSGLVWSALLGFCRSCLVYSHLVWFGLVWSPAPALACLTWGLLFLFLSALVWFCFASWFVLSSRGRLRE
jgi:hypothetical protein